MLNLAILISGRGSNMEAILKTIRKRKIPINPAIVISNKPDARGLSIAKRLGVKTEVVEHIKDKENRWDYDQKIIKTLKKYNVTPKNGLICLAGFMRIISPEFVKKFKNRILNIHPALLPSFPGLHAQRQAVEYGAKYSGCTVHIVDTGVDTGPIILQEPVPVKSNDTEDTLAKRILAKEHKLYPEAVKLFAEKRVKIIGRKTVIS
ncbi:MAG: phosphoribosylglycinamide formyltransferase [Nitrosopumilaceae archaeon]|nr:phosphoribosylglycinamide formyltransferase [Nitrosopumilaceae archaeon]NIU02131.1 phosphoribosylglycinamide formyltransferase [Nitrosopumilaceae archaeon]NIU88517.1 phosphoribosylglycinamide formyltransferase [Nitrosopumilaceae archaeon]NIV67164.1 phosphoribosylglycinamide formyltransferase [Nitrosopumilaceae archaeon]NIX62732.1 phosphoribosylglycinamide formyltransferase [Nitrosopumilaceae archaeon]